MACILRSPVTAYCGDCCCTSRSFSLPLTLRWTGHREQLKEAGKESSIRNFQDAAIATARPVIDLVDAIKPGSINYDQVQDPRTEEVGLSLQLLPSSSSLLCASC